MNFLMFACIDPIPFPLVLVESNPFSLNSLPLASAMIPV